MNGAPSTGTFTLLATHFQRLAELPSLYPNAKLWHLEVGASRAALDFKWRLNPGGGDGSHYGLILARTLGFPDQVTRLSLPHDLVARVRLSRQTICVSGEAGTT